MIQSSPSPILEARGLTKVFKDFWLRPRVTAVDAIDLEIRPHEVYGLLGPNGSGKSTTIKMALGLLFPTRGRLTVLGRLPTDVAIKKRIGYLPEESYLYRYLNPVETLDYYGRLFHQDRATRRKRIDMLLEMVGLSAVQRRPVGEFSKGMQRRVGLAQALINDPDLLILDEPTTGLDPIGTRQIKDIILQLKQRGKTVILSSHLLADVEDVCDRLCILYGGKIRAQGTVSELLTVSDSTLIETDTLSEQTRGKIRRLIESESGAKVHKIESPRKKLETLFLEIVQKAQREGAATSGATHGGAMAQFLTEPTDASGGTQLIEQLVKNETAARPAAQQETPLRQEPAEDAAVIRQLTGQTVKNESPAAPGAKPAEQADRSVIDGLLGQGPGAPGPENKS